MAKEETEEATRAEAYEQNTQENKVTKTSSEQNMDIQPKTMPRKRKKEDPHPKAMPRQKKKNDEKEKKDGDKEKEERRHPGPWGPATPPGDGHWRYYGPYIPGA